jgi:NitT/TauT family transport system substrate-binding protein
MRVAEKEGLFSKRNLEVEFIPVASAPERDQVVSAGQADGMINEVISTMFYNQDQIQVQIVRYARTATRKDALFSILAAADSGIESVNDLRGAEIGISEGTVIEYLTDRLLESEGFNQDEIRTIAVPKIPDRMALLGTGEIKSAMLPEPLSSLAAHQGAKLILDDTSHPEFSFSTISFRKDTIDKHPEAISEFLAAIEEATEMINENPSQWKPLLIDLKLIPAPLIETLEIPLFVTAGVPSEVQWNDVLDWAITKGLISDELSYNESVNSEFLP